MPPQPPALAPLWLSLQVAGIALLIILPAGTLIAWSLARRPLQNRVAKTIVETLLTLPLVLPPTVVGFYLLLLLGRGTPIGLWVNDHLHIHLLFTWQGAVLAATVMALPLFVRTAQATFASVDDELLAVGRTLGASEWQLLWRVVVPLSARGIIAGGVLAFARALGEFGATLIVAGNIEGETQTLPLALYDRVQAGRDDEALAYTLILTVVTVLLVGGARLAERRVDNC